jgi:hypothetical protein
MIPDYKCLVLTLRVECESAEAIMLLAHNPDGEPIPVYIELASGLKACRCGGKLKRARMRIVAPAAVRIKRVPHTEIPSKEEQYHGTL